MYAPYNILHLICLKHIPSACLRPLFQTTCPKPVFQTACLRLVLQPLVNLCSTLGSELQYTSYLYQTDTLNLYDTTSFKPCSTLIQPLVSTLRLTTNEPYCSNLYYRIVKSQQAWGPSSDGFTPQICECFSYSILPINISFKIY